jgi:hypothetical protein
MLMSFRIASSAYIGLVVYCLASLFFGPMGMGAYSDLESCVRQMGENITVLENLHEESQSHLDAAQSDPDTLALEALSLGYVAEGEVIVRIGFPETNPSPPNQGTLVPYKAPKGVDDTVLKTIALVTALCAFFISLAIKSPWKAHYKRKGTRNAAETSPRSAVSGSAPL